MKTIRRKCQIGFNAFGLRLHVKTNQGQTYIKNYLFMQFPSSFVAQDWCLDPVCEECMWLVALSHVLIKISNVHILVGGAGLQQENKAAFRLELVWTVCSTAQTRLSYNTITSKCPFTLCRKKKKKKGI